MQEVIIYLNRLYNTKYYSGQWQLGPNKYKHEERRGVITYSGRPDPLEV